MSRLSRAARLALGAALAAAALPGCQNKNTEGQDSNIAQPYGVPPLEEPETTTPESADAGASDEGGGQAIAVPAYGAPPPVNDN